MKEYFLKGYAITLQEKATEMEYSGLFNVITYYVYAIDTLDQYDYQTISIESNTKGEPFRATYENAMSDINSLKEKFGGSLWFATKKMTPSKAASDKSIKSLPVKTFIRQ